MLSILVLQYFLAMVPCIMYNEITDLPYAFLVLIKLLWSTEGCLKCFLDVIKETVSRVNFLPSLEC